MKTAELRKLKSTELETKLSETHHELAEAKRAQAAGELVNPRVITKSRKTIARIKTLINQPKVQEKED